MTADDVVLVVLARLEADAALTTALGGLRIYPDGGSEADEIPAMEYLVVSAPERESSIRVLIQFSWWAGDFATARTIGNRLRATLHVEHGPADVGGVPMHLKYQDGRSVTDPEPGIVSRSADFLFETVREI